MNPLYTLGYQNWDPDAITAKVRELNATLLDIRLVPTSPHPQWWHGSFEARFDAAGMASQYKTAIGFSSLNPKTPDTPVHPRDPEAYLMPIKMLLEASPLILMCRCRDHLTCHRTEAARYISEYMGGIEVIHLYPDIALPLAPTSGLALH